MQPKDEIEELKRRVKTLDVLLDDYTERIRRLEGWARPVELENHLLRRHLMRHGASFESLQLLIEDEEKRGPLV